MIAPKFELTSHRQKVSRLCKDTNVVLDLCNVIRSGGGVSRYASDTHMYPTCPLHTSGRRGKREAHKNWSMLMPARKSSTRYSNYLEDY